MSYEIDAQIFAIINPTFVRVSRLNSFSSWANTERVFYIFSLKQLVGLFAGGDYDATRIVHWPSFITTLIAFGSWTNSTRSSFKRAKVIAQFTIKILFHLCCYRFCSPAMHKTPRIEHMFSICLKRHIHRALIFMTLVWRKIFFDLFLHRLPVCFLESFMMSSPTTWIRELLWETRRVASRRFPNVSRRTAALGEPFVDCVLARCWFFLSQFPQKNIWLETFDKHPRR